MPVHGELVLVLALGQIHNGHEVVLTAGPEANVRDSAHDQREPTRAHTPSVEGDFCGPVVEGARHEDFLGGPRPAEHRGPGLGGGTLGFALQVLLPGQKLLDLLWCLSDRKTLT